jgi:outer membrane lipoprotein SlyB
MKDTNDKNKVCDKNDKSRNPDLITGAPGSHPVGTGLGAAAGGAAAGAAVGTVAGPVGTIAGAAVGAVVGGLAGKGVAEAVNPTAEADYWRNNHDRQPYAKWTRNCGANVNL